jgi:adenine/guanine phosphoribosyltransferase-like PRPP-binding protein
VRPLWRCDPFSHKKRRRRFALPAHSTNQTNEMATRVVFVETTMRMTACFADRVEAGRYLAEKFATYRDRDDVVVLALPRRGVPVAYEVATQLHLPLDVFTLK